VLSALADFSLPPERFGHRSHLLAAWQCLREAPLPQASQRFCGLLTAYVDHLGARDKYHHSLTVALLQLIAARMRPGEEWATFAAANADLFDAAPALLARHYSPEVLHSAAARRDWVRPDREPLPDVPDH
jgi:hypothetical protein